jgi:hypothetical protein
LNCVIDGLYKSLIEGFVYCSLTEVSTNKIV